MPLNDAQPVEPRGAAALEPGAIVAGKYRVEHRLGRGGMGQVFAAVHLQSGERVAIKLLHQSLNNSAENLDRFLQEGRAAATIESPHVARVLDAGSLEDGSPYLVLEYLEGRDLAKTIKKSGPFPITQAVDFIVQACHALSEAHSRGIIHRDLKPSNLFLTTRADGSPFIKVLDFGISKFVYEGHSHTQTSDILGSPPYMSPEQLRSTKHVDHRTDIWSLGTILFELLTGRTPFVADTMADLCMKIVAEPSPPLRSLLPSAPPGLEAILLRCHEKDPAARFSSAQELSAALAPFALAKDRTMSAAPAPEAFQRRAAAAKTVAATPAELMYIEARSAQPQGNTTAYPGHTAVGNTSVKWNNSIEKQPPQAAKKPWLLPLIALGAILIVGGAAFMAWSSSRSGENAQSSAEASPIPLPQAASVTELAPLEAQEPPPPLPAASAKPMAAPPPPKTPLPKKPAAAPQPTPASQIPGGGLFNDRK